VFVFQKIPFYLTRNYLLCDKTLSFVYTLFAIVFSNVAYLIFFSNSAVYLSYTIVRTQKTDLEDKYPKNNNPHYTL